LWIKRVDVEGCKVQDFGRIGGDARTTDQREQRNAKTQAGGARTKNHAWFMTL
jgi:hypothetical protein